ncbi:hypothetical protein ACVWWN_003545 [Mycobacterium sp. URHB0021]|jgi:hypothetical protein
MSRITDSDAVETATAADSGANPHRCGDQRPRLQKRAGTTMARRHASAGARRGHRDGRGRPVAQISITLTGRTQSIDVLLADTGNIALTSLGGHGDARSYPMRVVPIRLDTLSDPPAIRVVGRGVTEPTQLRLVVELITWNPHTDTTSAMRCSHDSVRPDAQSRSGCQIPSYTKAAYPTSGRNDPRKNYTPGEKSPAGQLAEMGRIA